MFDPAPGVGSRFSPTTVDHFQNPRNVGRLPDADAIGRVDDRETDTTIELYVKLTSDGRVERATFRTLGCSACIAASSIATELLLGLEVSETRHLDATKLEEALGGLPQDKRYCADLVALAITNAAAPLAASGGA